VNTGSLVSAENNCSSKISLQYTRDLQPLLTQGEMLESHGLNAMFSLCCTLKKQFGWVL